MRRRRTAGLVTAGLLLAQAAAAEVKLAAPDALVIEHRFQVAATPEPGSEALTVTVRNWPLPEAEMVTTGGRVSRGTSPETLTVGVRVVS